MGDPHIVVVDHDREIIGRAAVGPQDDQIVELGVRDSDGALNPIANCRGAFLRRLQPDDR